MLNLMQNDLLKEWMNTFVGKAACLLSEMVDQRIKLNIPKVDLVDLTDGFRQLSYYNSLKDFKHVITSSVQFGNLFNGKAYLIFPATQAKRIVQACLHDPGNMAHSEEDFADTDFDVLKEIANVILNAILGELGNTLEVKMEYSLPEIDLLFVSETAQSLGEPNNVYVLILYTNFFLADIDVTGMVIIALSMNSITLIINKLNDYLEKLDE